MGDGLDTLALAIFVALFALVSVLGFVASKWRAAADLEHLDEWGLGGRSFGTLITWFLLGGDLYTAYTFIAIPALVYGAGALGMFGLTYTVIVYPIVFMIMPRLWSVSHRHGYVTPAAVEQLLGSGLLLQPGAQVGQGRLVRGGRGREGGEDVGHRAAPAIEGSGARYVRRRVAMPSEAALRAAAGVPPRRAATSACGRPARWW